MDSIAPPFARHCWRCCLFLSLWLWLGAASTPALAEKLELEGTPWAEAARAHGLAPELLYALTIVESQRSIGVGRVAPWPWSLRTPAGSQWLDSRDEALQALALAKRHWPANRIDVGAAQVNLGWHADRIVDPGRLFDLEYNLHVAAEILAEAIGSTRDPVIAVGRYHHWRDPERVRRYGNRVWQVYRQVYMGSGAYRFDIMSSRTIE